MYSQSEAALLTGMPRSTVRRWLELQPSVFGPAATGQPRLLTFVDVISLRAVAALRRAGLSAPAIQRGALAMAADLETSHPLACEELVSEGVDRYFLAGKPHAGDGAEACAAQLIVRESLADVKYDSAGRKCHRAKSWEPPGVVVDPLRQRGAPCIAGSRVQVALLHRYREAGESPERLAAFFELDVHAVRKGLHRMGLQWYEGLYRQAA